MTFDQGWLQDNRQNIAAANSRSSSGPLPDHGPSHQVQTQCLVEIRYDGQGKENEWLGAL